MKEDDGALPLAALRQCVTPETYEWLEEHERSQAVQDDEDGDIVDLFECGRKNDDEEDYGAGVAVRVQEWTSSRFRPDGIGGYECSILNVIGETNVTKDAEGHSVRIQYILSDAPGGHGDNVWAASRHVSNLLADPMRCRVQIFGGTNESDQEYYAHPLVGRTFVELGAGAGLPSWAALACGASVVICTDLPIPPRIRALAEAAQRNRQRRRLIPNNQDILVQVCPHTWGTPVEPILSLLLDPNETSTPFEHHESKGRRWFDVIVAADCIYNPEFHTALLDSIRQLLQPETGVALLPFCLHGNAPDERVWSICSTAEVMGFVVEQLQPQQLSPQHAIMDPKRALVHTLRLTLPKQ